MSINTILSERSGNTCELCGNRDPNLQVYTVPPKKDEIPENQVVLCNDCFDKITANNFEDAEYWRFLTGSIWSEVPSVQALSYRLLTKLRQYDWAAETLESVFPDERIVEWANSEANQTLIHKDAFGVVLEHGDTVILTQNLNVKGANFIAPKGTTVRKIRLVSDNEEQIEGKINGDTIVILTKFVKRQA